MTTDTELYLGLRKQAEELYPESEQAQEEFVGSFVEKVASIFKDLKYDGKTVIRPGDHADQYLANSVAENFWARGAASAAGKAMVGGIGGLGMAGIMGLANIVNNHSLHNKYLSALKESMQTNRILREAGSTQEGAKKLLTFGNTIFKFAPHVATDSNLLSSILANAFHGDGIDPMTIRTLTELESRYRDMGSSESFNPKMWM